MCVATFFLGLSSPVTTHPASTKFGETPRTMSVERKTWNDDDDEEYEV
jgi:hypothetical protein